MELGDLDRAGQLLLVAVVRHMVHVDDKLSPGEVHVARGVAEALGEERWLALAAEARERYSTWSEICEALGELTELAHRRAIVEQARILAIFDLENGKRMADEIAAAGSTDDG